MPQIPAAIATALNAVGFTAAGGAMITGKMVTGWMISQAVGVGVSVLVTMLQPKPRMQGGGIATKGQEYGADKPRKFILGYYATAGNLITERYDEWDIDKDDNKMLTQVIGISDTRIDGIEEFYMGDTTFKLRPQVLPAHVNYHYDDQFGQRPDAGDYKDHMWIKAYDGTQTTVSDVLMLAPFSEHPERPTTDKFIMRGTAYYVLTTKYLQNNPTYTGLPDPKVVVRGRPLYDPRRDSSNGFGSGNQRWGVESTYTFSANPVVMVYNILRGITIGPGQVYGAEAKPENLPLANFIAAMNVCDEDGTQPASTNWKDDIKRYRAGMEISVDEEPASVVMELMKSCGGKISINNGSYLVSVGPPQPSIRSITDNNVLYDKNSEYVMSQGLSKRFNAITASYPDPRLLWQANDAEEFKRDDLIATDGKYLPANLNFPTVPFPRQVRRLMRETLNDSRRLRQHTIVLPPSFISLNQHDTLSWTSTENGYINKLFEVTSTSIDPIYLSVTVNLLERDPADYDFDVISDGRIPTVPSYRPVRPVNVGVNGFNVYADTVGGDNGTARRPAIRMEWVADVSYANFTYEIRNAVTQEPFKAGTLATSTGSRLVGQVNIGRHYITDALPAASYEVRAKPVRPNNPNVTWGSWITVVMQDIRISRDDISDDVLDDLDGAIANLDTIANTISDLQANTDVAIDGVLAEVNAAVEHANQVAADAEASAREYANTQIGIVANNLATSVANLNSTIATNIANTRSYADGLVSSVRNENANTAANIRQEILANTNYAVQAFESGIQSYDVTIQGQFNTLSGRVDVLQAKADSENLLTNGGFSNSAPEWTKTNSYAVTTVGNSDSFDVTCPEPFSMRIGNGASGSISQSNLLIEQVTENTRIVTRFSAGRAGTNATLSFAFTWKDAAGVVIDTTTQIQTIEGNSIWKPYAFQIDLPDNSAYFDLTVTKASGGTRINLAGLSVQTADISVEARLSDLEAVSANTSDTVALLQSNVEARFASANARIDAETQARANSEAAIVQSVNNVAANVANHAATLSNHASAIANQNNAITQTGNTIRAQFGPTNLILDPYFEDNTYANWQGDMSLTRETRNPAHSLNRYFDMPGAYAVRFTGGSSADDKLVRRYSNEFPVSTADTYSFGFYYQRLANNLTTVVFIEWLNNAGEVIGTSEQVASPTGLANVGVWNRASATGQRPIAGASKGRLVFKKNTGTGNQVWVTGFVVSKDIGFASNSGASMSELKTAFANSQEAFAEYQSNVSTRFTDTAADYNQKIATVSNSTTGIASSVANLTATVANNSGKIDSLSGVVANNNTVLTNRIDLMQANVANNFAVISNTQIAQANTIGAHTQSIGFLQSNVQNAFANIGELRQTVSNTQGSVATLRDEMNVGFVGVRRSMNLIDDPYFEDFSNKWSGTLVSSTATVSRVVTSASKQIRDVPGPSSIRIQNNNQTDAMYSQPFTVSLSQRYSLAFHAFTGGGTSRVGVRIDWYNGVSELIGSSDTVYSVTTDSDYTKYSSGSAFAPPLGAVSGVVVIQRASANNGNIWVSGIEVVSQDAAQFEAAASISRTEIAIANAQQSVIHLGSNVRAEFANTFSQVNSAITLVSNNLVGLTTRVQTSETGLANSLIRISNVENNLVNNAQALAIISNTVNVSHASSIGRLQSNVNVLTTNVASVFTRVTTLETTTANTATIVNSHAVLISNQANSIARLTDTVASQFGPRQLNRDPEFINGIDFYGGVLTLPAAGNRIVARNRANGNWWINAMPGANAFQFRNADANSGALHMGLPFDVAPSEAYDFSFFYGAVANGPTIRVYIQWLNNAGSAVGSSAFQIGDAVGFGIYRQGGATGITPPSDATVGRLVAQVDTAGSSSTAYGYLTALTVSKQSAYEYVSSALITETRNTVANNNTAFTNYVANNNSRVANTEADIRSQANAINQRATFANLDSAIAASEQRTTAQYNGLSAGGRFRTVALANAAGSFARIGIVADAGNSTVNTEASIHISAESDGSSYVTVNANRFAIVGNQTPGMNRTAPFIVQGGTAYISNAVFQSATFGAIHIGNNELFVPYTWAVGSELTIPSNRDKSNPVLIMERNIPDFTGGGYIVAFTSFVRGGDAWGSAYMEIDGVKQPITRFGVRTSLNSNARFSIPVQLFGTGNGNAATNIKVYMYASHWDSDDYGSNEFHVSNRRITLSGTRR